MKALKHLRVGSRLAIAFAVVTMLLVAMAGFARWGLNDIGEHMDNVLHSHYAKLKTVISIDDDVNLQARVVRNLALMDSDAQRQQEIVLLMASRERLVKSYAELRARLSTPEDLALFEQVQAEHALFTAHEEELLQHVRHGDLAAAKTVLLDKLRPRQLSYQQRLQALTELEEGQMETAGESTLATVGSVTRLTLAFAALGLVLALASGVVITRSVTVPVAQVVRSLKAVASGDLTVDVAVNRGDELGELQQALADTVAGLRQLVNEVRTGIDSVTTASGQIAAGNQDLSSRTEQQAASLQETASTMEQMTATVRHNAHNASAASGLAATAAGAAERGGDVVGEVVATMDEISASSRQVAEIVGVIDDIAFQTNILALNAAVEAARAGGQGRGFAVVAGEVRTLAQRSAAAAKDIKALIGTSADKVAAGSQQVAAAGQAMHDIVAQVRQVNQLIGEIAGTAGEQSRGIEQVNIAVTQMDQVTQQNAALVEESAAAASSLSRQAQALAQAVAAFQVERPAAAAAPALEATAPASTGRAAAARRPTAHPPATAALASQPAWASC
ncbi:methyl-accepting chemotaxis protein [Roseateles sp. DC23W]|uniref:Methyl-accepting chemotaxis protein n=1 Tax=Pelomonas dachongensis TaxID=3299029 RepID=A0ABW7ET66_9BURK